MPLLINGNASRPWGVRTKIVPNKKLQTSNNDVKISSINSVPRSGFRDFKQKISPYFQSN